MIWLRSLIFWFLACLMTIPVGLALVLCIPFPLSWRFAVVGLWRECFLGLTRWVIGLKTVVLGRENIPQHPALVLAKHQSAWETVALQAIFKPLVFVLKKELLRIPFFGWGLSSVRMIGIDRNAGRGALKQMLEEGQDRLEHGIWVVVFPEGTRVPPGERVPYKAGAAYLAVKAGTPVLPVAHNAGELWPKKALAIRPGTITVSIGPLIETQGKKDAEVNAAVEAWIEAEMHRLSPHRYPSPPASA